MQGKSSNMSSLRLYQAFAWALLADFAFSLPADNSTLDSSHSRAWAVGQAVNTTSGTIVGHAATNTTNVSEYLGIPYAQPPIGALRFAAPQPYQSNETFIASKFVSIQLFLDNIYTMLTIFSLRKLLTLNLIHLVLAIHK
jgi:hypothetical protein